MSQHYLVKCNLFELIEVRHAVGPKLSLPCKHVDITITYVAHFSLY